MTFAVEADHSNVARPPPSPWIYRPVARVRARARLFCFPHAGVGASVFRLWPAGLPAELDICAIQLPGRTMRLSEPAIDSIPILTDAIVAALTPELDLPFALLGHSMGAVLATEVAHALMERGLPQPHRLIVSGRRPPRMPSSQPLLSGLSDAKFVEEINRRYGGIPQEILSCSEILEMLLPALRADILSLETHHPPIRQPLGCPISAFCGSNDELASPDHLDAWRLETESTFDLRVFPGGHFYLEPERAAVLAQLSDILAPLLVPQTQSCRHECS